MKLALFVHNFPPEFLGGTEQVVAALARAFRAAGDEVLVVAGSEEFAPGGSATEEEWEGVRVLRVRRDPSETYGIELRYPITGSLISEILANEQPDAVQVHHWWTLSGDIVQRATGLGIASGVTIHDLWTVCPRFFRQPPPGIRCPVGDDHRACVECMQRDLPGASPKEIGRSLDVRTVNLTRELSLADFVVAPSQAAVVLLRRHLPWEGEVTVIPHGLLTVPERRERSERGENEPVRVGSFGNLVPEKGLHLLVDGLAKLHCGVELRLSGHCPDPSYIERLERRAEDLGIPFTWTGPYTVDDHPAWDLDLAVFPSLCQESYGLVVDEALARGVPVVVSNNGALPERARLGGCVVRHGGVMPLHVALARLVRCKKELSALRATIPATFPTIAEAAEKYRGLLLEKVNSVG